MTEPTDTLEAMQRDLDDTTDILVKLNVRLAHLLSNLPPESGAEVRSQLHRRSEKGLIRLYRNLIDNGTGPFSREWSACISGILTMRETGGIT